MPKTMNSITLWHYTSVDSFYKIMESDIIRLTNSDYLNDLSEMRHGFDLYIKFLENNPMIIGGVLFGNGKAIDYINEIKNQSSNYHIFSLSENIDSLYQWTAYTSNIGGYAIGFTFHTEEPTQDDQHGQRRIWTNKLTIPHPENPYSDRMCIEKCTYEEEITLHEDSIHFLNCDNIRDIPGSFIHTIKHPAFDVEKEWRVIYPHEVADNSIIRWSEKPYVEACFNKDIVTSVMVSPRGDQTRNKRRLEDFNLF